MPIQAINTSSCQVQVFQRVSGTDCRFFFLVAWFGSCSAEKQQSFHEFVFAWHMFCFAEKLKESNFQLRSFTQQCAVTCKRVTVLRRFTQKCAVTCKRTTSLCRLRK